MSNKKKDVSPAASRRDDAEAKKHTRPKHAVLEADQRISGFDTGHLGRESFPKHSTASGDVAAKEAQIKGNRPGVTPKGKK